MTAAPFPPVIRPGLGRVRRALARLGHPEERFAAVLIAGTNGKGSVAALVSSVLRTGGYPTGLYTSPHLVRETERVQVDGRSPSAAAWTRLARRVAAVGAGLTEFEAQTVLAFLHFAESGVQIAVVEVGLGGRLDATNALPAPEVTVITSIGHDHHAWLGPTLRHVYREKRGIARPGTVLIQNLPKPFWSESDRWSAETGVIPWTFGREIGVTCLSSSGGRGQTIAVRCPGERVTLRVPFFGRHQAANGALAAAVSVVLRRRGWRIGAGDLKAGFSRARWPGRFELIRRRPPVVLDGAHNEDAARALSQTWARAPWGRERATLIFGCLKDKNASALVGALAPRARRAIVVPLPSPRSQAPEALRRLWARRVPAESAADFSEAWRRARAAGGPVLVTGSLYLVGEAMKFFESQERRAA